MGLLWGIDLGGTKIEGVVLEGPDSSAILARKRVPTEANQGYEHIIGQVRKLINTIADELGARPERIGMGTPGTTDPDSGLLKNSNTVCLNGMPFQQDLQDHLGVQFTMANDANCFALAEALMGAVPEEVPDARVVFGVIMGTGVGGGIVVNGSVINGRHGIGGEWGHNALDASGGMCYCGKEGCVETIISGPALERYYQKTSGNAVRLPEIYARHKQGNDAVASETIYRLMFFFGKGIARIINVLDPDVIVLGGGVGNIEELQSDGRKAALQHVFNPTLETAFLRPKLGDSAGVFGAALLNT